MPLGRKHLRRSRDAPTGGIGHPKRATSRLGADRSEVKLQIGCCELNAITCIKVGERHESNSFRQFGAVAAFGELQNPGAAKAAIGSSFRLHPMHQLR